MKDGKVKHETLGNLSDLSRDLIELMRQRLAQGEPLSGVGQKWTIQRSWRTTLSGTCVTVCVSFCSMMTIARRLRNRDNRSWLRRRDQSRLASKDATLRTASGFPVQSFQDLLKDLATLNRNTVRLESSGAEFHQLTEATHLQRRVFELLATPSSPAGSQNAAFAFAVIRRPIPAKYRLRPPNDGHELRSSSV